jgi:hypothetical protein
MLTDWAAYVNPSADKQTVQVQERVRLLLVTLGVSGVSECMGHFYTGHWSLVSVSGQPPR